MINDPNVEWSTEKVVSWLTINGWQSAIDIFIGKYPYPERTKERKKN